MTNRLLLLFLCFQITLFAQETETVVIKKANYSLYRGVLKETNTWYLLIDSENNYYLARIEKPADEVYDWFVRFKDSQNIYKTTPTINSPGGYVGQNQYKTLHFKKENEPGEILNFYVDKPAKSTIVLTSLEDNNVFTFELVDN